MKKPDIDIIREQEKRKKKQEARFRAVKDAVNAAKEQPNVLILLRYILNESGYRDDLHVIGPTRDIQIRSTEFNLGRRDIYRRLTNFMSPATQNLVEKREE